MNRTAWDTITNHKQRSHCCDLSYSFYEPDIHLPWIIIIRAWYTFQGRLEVTCLFHNRAYDSEWYKGILTLPEYVELDVEDSVFVACGEKKLLMTRKTSNPCNQPLAVNPFNVNLFNSHLHVKPRRSNSIHKTFSSLYSQLLSWSICRENLYYVFNWRLWSWKFEITAEASS